MSGRTCIISLAVVLVALVAVWIVHTCLPDLRAEGKKPTGASAAAQLPVSMGSDTGASGIGQTHAVVNASGPAGPIPTTQESSAVSYLEILNDRAAPLHSRVAGADSLGKSRSSNAVASLIVIVGDQFENVILRYKAARALGNIGDQIAATALSDLLLDSTVDNHLRLVSALALGNMGGPEAVQSLTDAANDTNSIVRFKAIQGLMRTHDETAIEPVVKAIRDGDADIQALAIQAYGSLAGRDGVATISNTMANTDSVFIKLACLGALGEVGGAEAERILREYTNNSNDLMRINAQNALCNAEEAAAQ